MSAVDGWALLAYQGARARCSATLAGRAPGGEPAGDDGLADEQERDGPLDHAGGAVAGLPGAEELPGVIDRDLDGPPEDVSLDHLRGGGAVSVVTRPRS